MKPFFDLIYNDSSEHPQAVRHAMVARSALRNIFVDRDNPRKVRKLSEEAGGLLQHLPFPLG